MSDQHQAPVVAGRAPERVEVEAGKPYAWCTCGRSEPQPLCDGSHRGTRFSPVVFKPEAAGEVWLCTCKATRNPPYCDGSHARLEGADDA